MNNLNIIGNLWGTSGYASHTRSLINALYKHAINISLESQKFNGWETQVNDNELKMLKQEPYIDGDTLAITMPHQWSSIIKNDGTKFYGYCVFEGDKVPNFWINIFLDDRVTGIIVPSTHTHQAIVNTVKSWTSWIQNKVMQKIIIIPHGVDTELFKPKIKEPGQTFKFLANKGWCSGMNDRGGIQYLIKAFNKEFNHEEPVELIIKLNTAYNGPGWNLANEMNKLELRENGGRIHINTESIPYDKLPQLYQLGDVFVSPNMSEAFGLTILEAMSCGIPVIVSDFGGQTDFVNNQSGWFIKGNKKEVTWDLMYEGIRWQEPNIDDLQYILRKVYENLKSSIEIKGLFARHIAEQYTWNKTALSLIETFNNNLVQKEEKTLI